MSICRSLRELEWRPSPSPIVSTNITWLLKRTIPTSVGDAISTYYFSTNEVYDVLLLLRLIRIVFYLLRLEVVSNDTVNFTRSELMWFNKAPSLFMVLKTGTAKFLFAFMSVPPTSIHFIYIPYNSTPYAFLELATCSVR